MKAVILALALTLGSVGNVKAEAPKIADGSIVYVLNGNQVVQNYTKSKITHVGIIVNIDNEPWMYEAELPKVRKMKISQYVEMLAKENVNRQNGEKLSLFIMQPKVPYTGQQIANAKGYLDEQIGRRYSLRGFVHERQVDTGIHCSSLVSQALGKTGRYKFSNPDAVSPSALVLSVKKGYSNFQVAVKNIPREAPSNRWANRTKYTAFSCEESFLELMHWFVPIR